MDHANAAFEARFAKMDPPPMKVWIKGNVQCDEPPTVLDAELTIQFQQVGEHLIHIAFPFRNVGNGENGIDALLFRRE